MQLFNKLEEISKILHIILYIYIIYQYVVDSTSFKKHSDVFCHVLSHATATVDGLLGVAGIIDSSPVDHSRRFPYFSTSKYVIHDYNHIIT